MILVKPPLRRRVLAAPTTRPSGNVDATIAPGAIDAELYVEVVHDVAAPSAIDVDGGRLSSALAAALAAADVGAARATLRGPVRVAQRVTEGKLTVTAPLTVTRSIPERDLSRAMARAVFWATSVTYPDGSSMPHASSDGGARIQQLVERWPDSIINGEIIRDTRQLPRSYRGPVRARFSVTIAAQNGPPAPAPAPAPIATVPLGKPQAQLTREEIVRFQQALIALGYSNGGRTVADGAIGPNTRASVLAFQQAHQRTNAALAARVRNFLAAVDPLATDGTLGPATQRALNWYLLPVANGGNGLSIASVPATQGGGSVPVVRPPAPTPSTPGTTTPVVRPPGPVAPPPPARPAPAQAGMSGTAIALAALGAAAVGVGIAYKDKLFGGRRGRAVGG